MRSTSSATGSGSRRPARKSSRRASSDSTAGATEVAAAMRRAELDPYSPATLTPPASSRAASMASLVPEPISRTSSGTFASSSAVIGFVQAWAKSGAQAIMSRSRPTTSALRSRGRDTDSMSPRSQVCRRTRSMTVVEFSTESPMSIFGCAARKVVRWCGMRYSATVSEALTLTVPARASRIARAPA